MEKIHNRFRIEVIRNARGIIYEKNIGLLLIVLAMTSCNIRSLTVTRDPIKGQLNSLSFGKKVEPTNSIQLSKDGKAEIMLYLYYATMKDSLKITSSFRIRKEHDQCYVIPSKVVITNEDGTPIAKYSSIGPLALAIQHESESSLFCTTSRKN